MTIVRAMPVIPDACGRLLHVSRRHTLGYGAPGKNGRPHPTLSACRAHPIHHRVAGFSSVHADKAGRPRVPHRPVRICGHLAPLATSQVMPMT